MSKRTASPTHAVSAAQLRAFFWQRQGLDGGLAGQAADAVLARTGWSRSVGGCGPYLALFSRSRACLSREAVDAAVAALQIHELPSARGCTYVVPAADFALALRAGQGHGDAAEIETARRHCGVTDQELDRLCAKVLDTLSRGPLDPAQIKEAAGDAVRHLGDVGKKRGLTTTLPLALGRLQGLGEIRRVPVNGRLDQQRYRYALWRPSPLVGDHLTAQDIAVELARRFFRWAGPATVKQLAWWAGLSVKAAQAAAQALPLRPLAEGDDRLLFDDDLDALRDTPVPEVARFALVGSLDNLCHLRREVAGLLDQADAASPLWGEQGPHSTSLYDMPHHGILDRGRLIGFWDYDGQGEIVWRTFAGAPSGLAQEVARTEAFVRDQLGDARSFSLDSPEKRGPRLARLRAA